MKTLDVNGDQKTDVSDPIHLLNYQFRGGSAPPAPFPSCGIDEEQLSSEIECRGDWPCDV